MNVLAVTGNLGRDAEQRFAASGDSIVSFSLPVKSGFGEKAKTSWVRCTMFGKRGISVFPYLTKGALVGVYGEFSMNEFVNKEGQKQSSPECRVSELTLLGSKTSNQQSAPELQRQKPESRNVQGAQGGAFDDMSDDIPFAKHGDCGAWRVI